MYQDLFFDYLTLELSKLTDPAEMGKFKNLTFFFLIDLLKTEVDENTYNKFYTILNQLAVATEFFRNRRNKIVAHRDLSYAEQKDEFGISRQRVEDTLLLARNYLNEIELHFFGNQTMYREFITDLNDDGTALLINLAKSLAYDDLVEKQKIPVRLWESFGQVFEKAL